MVESFDEYRKRLGEGLAKQCGRRRATTILAEIEDHLSEGIEELVGRGMSRDVAEQTMIGRFGNAESVCGWYAEVHRRPSVWRAARYPLIAVGAATTFWGTGHYFVPFSFQTGIGWLGVLNALLAIAIVVCFRAKRFVSGVIALAATGVFGLLVGAFCLFSVPMYGEHGQGVIARWSVNKDVREAKDRIALNERHLAIFAAGRETFRSPIEPLLGVGRFHDARGYLTPIYYQLEDPRMQEFIEGQPTQGIFASYGEARNFWIDQPSRVNFYTGAKQIFYIADASEELAADRRIVQTLPLAQNLPLRAKLPAFAQAAYYPGCFFLCFGVLADVVGGVLRVIVDAIRRRRRQAPRIAAG